jgi:hypothetical protein
MMLLITEIALIRDEIDFNLAQSRDEVYIFGFAYTRGRDNKRRRTPDATIASRLPWSTNHIPDCG